MSQAVLRDKEKNWQRVERICRLLISRLAQLANCQDDELIFSLKALRKALREGESLIQMEKLIKAVTDQIAELGHVPLEASKVYSSEQLKLLSDIFYVLLDRINFPTQYSSHVNKIKLQLSEEGLADDYHRLLSGMTSLAELLTEIFNTVQHDKIKIEHYLQHISRELQHLDEGINTSGILHHEKQLAEEHIKSKVEMEVMEMENSMTTLVDLGDFKATVQKTMKTIRGHMESFKESEEQRNQQADKNISELGQKLKLMEQQCEELKQQVLEKHQQALSDSLTGLRNRLAYEEAIQYELERFKRYGRPVALIMLDLDKFKNINDTLGHGVGDKVLQYVARILAKNIRNVDFLARYGGEEFVIILPELGLQEAKKVAEKICKAVQANKLNVDGKAVNVTISGGIARVRQDDTSESLFERADTALYLAKERGRNRCETE